MTINNDLIDQLLANYQDPEDVLGDNGLLKRLTKAVLERALQVELTHHLGYDKHSPLGNNSGNSRNGRSKKTLKGEFGNLPVEVPRGDISGGSLPLADLVGD
jgi:putative transposase